MAGSVLQNPAMDITRVIASNLGPLIDEHPTLNTSEKVAAASGVGYGTVRRTRHGQGNVTVQNLELIARVFKLRAVDLMKEPSAVKYQTAELSPTMRLILNQPPTESPEERLLVQGFRAGSKELRSVMLEVARQAVANQERPGRSDHQ